MIKYEREREQGTISCFSLIPRILDFTTTLTISSISTRVIEHLSSQPVNIDRAKVNLGSVACMQGITGHIGMDSICSLRDSSCQTTFELVLGCPIQGRSNDILAARPNTLAEPRLLAHASLSAT